jgi:hypothetical protein
MAGMDWFRWHHGSVTDPKFQLVAKKAGAKPAEVLAVWACLLEEASQATDRGNPGEIDFDSIDCLLGLEDGLALRIHEKMTDRKLFAKDGSIAAWERRQPKREREDDKSTERVKAFREKQRQETPGNAKGGQETPRGEKSREEESNSVAKATGDAGQVPSGRAPEVPDPIFGDGLAFLVRAGVPEKGARSFLGKMRKALNDDLVAVELLVKAQQLEVSDPVPWLRAAAQKRLSTGRTGSTGVAL